MKNLNDFRKTVETGVDPRLCSAGNIDMLSTEGFLPWKRKGLLQHTVDNEIPALARLTCYENHFWLSKKQVSVVRSNGCPY